MPVNENYESRMKSSVERIRKELDHWLDVAQNQGDRALGVFGLERSAGRFSPRIDVIESLEQIFVRVNLPGIEPTDVDVTLAGNMLTIKGEIPECEEEADSTVHLQERSAGAFSRSIPMPSPVDSDEVQAKATQGVLTVTLNKTERSKAKQVTIKSE